MLEKPRMMAAVAAVVAEDVQILIAHTERDISQLNPSTVCYNGSWRHVAWSLVQFPTLGNCSRNHPYSSSHPIGNKTEYGIEGAFYKNAFYPLMACNTVFGFPYVVDI